MRNNKHDNQYLQNAWNKYGAESFEFIIIEECSVEDLNEREIYWIKFYKDQKISYNILNGGDGLDNLGTHLSEETKRKIGEKNRQNMLGKKLSEETKQKMSEAHKGRKMSEETRKKCHEINVQRGREQRRLAKLDVQDIKDIRDLREKNIPVKEIAKKYNTTTQNIYDIINRKRWGWVE